MPEGEIHVETARLDDLPALVGLLGELFSIEQDFHPDAARQEKGLRLLLQHPDRAVILVARRGTKALVGMVTGQLVFSTAEGAASVWLEDLIVSRNCRGRGLGQRLLRHALDWAQARGATRAQLLVDLDNLPALAFYDRLNWQPTRLAARRMMLRGPVITAGACRCC